MTLQQATDWLNANADRVDAEKMQMLDLYYKLLQQSETQKRLNRLHRLIDRSNEYWR